MSVSWVARAGSCAFPSPLPAASTARGMLPRGVRAVLGPVMTCWSSSGSHSSCLPFAEEMGLALMSAKRHKLGSLADNLFQGGGAGA